MGEQVNLPRGLEERGEVEAGCADGQALVGLCSEAPGAGGRWAGVGSGCCGHRRTDAADQEEENRTDMREEHLQAGDQASSTGTTAANLPCRLRQNRSERRQGQKQQKNKQMQQQQQRQQQ